MQEWKSAILWLRKSPDLQSVCQRVHFWSGLRLRSVSRGDPTTCRQQQPFDKKHHHRPKNLPTIWQDNWPTKLYDLFISCWQTHRQYEHSAVIKFHMAYEERHDCQWGALECKCNDNDREGYFSSLSRTGLNSECLQWHLELFWRSVCVPYFQPEAITKAAHIYLLHLNSASLNCGRKFWAKLVTCFWFVLAHHLKTSHFFLKN